MSKRDAVPIARFGLREGVVYFNHAILVMLDAPKYVQFLYEDKRKLLLLSGNNDKLPYSLAIPTGVYKNRSKDFRICHKHLLDAFILRLGWDKNENYSIIGTLDQRFKVVIFELEKASKTEPDQDLLLNL